MIIFKSWKTEEGILDNVKKIGITQAFNIVDTIFHNPYDRIKIRNFFFQVLEKNNIIFPECHCLWDWRFKNWTHAKKLWNIK